MTPFTTVLTRWVETIANESARLDPLTRKRLGALAGHSIAIELRPPGETTTLSFDGRSIRVQAGSIATPSVIVRGTPSALAAAFIGADIRGGSITIEGDEVVLGQFRSIVRDYRPEIFSPLYDIVGPQISKAVTSAVELGFAALSAIARSLNDESGRLAREGVRQRYLTTPEFDSLLDSMQALRIRIDRLDVRTNALEHPRDHDE